jgi:hypothetical protein
MNTTLEDLYPPGALHLPVNPALLAPRLADPPPERQNTGRWRDYYAGYILGELPQTPEPETLALVDKAFPHSLFDLMVLVARDDVLRTSVGDLPDSVLASLLQVAVRFVDYLSDPATVGAFGLDGGQVTIGWNYDPTIDRDNGQWWDKRLHAHLNCWGPRTCRAVRPVPLHSITDTVLRRSLVDPVAYLGHEVFVDALRHADLPADCRLLGPDAARDAAERLPVGVKVALPGWSFLAEPECRRLLRLLHGTCAAAYRALHEAFTDPASPTGLWHRPRLLPAGEVAAKLDQMSWLQPGTRAQLMALRHRLRDLTAHELALMRQRPGLANRCLTLSGLSYHMALFTPGQISSTRPLTTTTALYAVVQVKAISSIGSSPAVGGAVATAADRSSGPPMTRADHALRRAFQHEYLTRVGAQPAPNQGKGST